MPFKSEKQRRYLWANEPEIARDWTDTYGSKIQKAQGGRIGFALGSGELNRMAMEMFGKELRLLSEDEMGQLRYEWEMKKGMIEENYGDPYAKGGRIGYYTGGQSIPSEYTVEDARKSAMQDKLGGITDIMKKADLYRQGDIGQMYMADGGIMRVPFRSAGAVGASHGSAAAAAGGVERGGNTGGDDKSYQTVQRPNIHIDTSPTSQITGPRIESSANEWVQNLNHLNAIRAAQQGTKFSPYQGGSRPQGGLLNPMGLMSLLGGFIKKSSPFTFAATGINALRNKFGPAWTDWTDSGNLAEFLNKRKAAQYKDAIATDNLYDPNARIQNTSFEQDYNVPYYLDEFQPEGLALIDTTNLYDEILPEEEEARMQNIKDYYIV